MLYVSFHCILDMFCKYRFSVFKNKTGYLNAIFKNRISNF